MSFSVVLHPVLFVAEHLRMLLVVLAMVNRRVWILEAFQNLF